MNARTKPDFLTSQPASVDMKFGQQEQNPVLKHMDYLQEQLQEQLDSLNTVVESMQRISDIMDRMAKKKCRLNSAGGLPERGKKGDPAGHSP